MYPTDASDCLEVRHQSVEIEIHSGEAKNSNGIDQWIKKNIIRVVQMSDFQSMIYIFNLILLFISSIIGITNHLLFSIPVLFTFFINMGGFLYGLYQVKKDIKSASQEKINNILFYSVMLINIAFYACTVCLFVKNNKLS